MTNQNNSQFTFNPTIAQQALSRIFDRHTTMATDNTMDHWLAIHHLTTEEGYSDSKAQEIIDTFGAVTTQNDSKVIVDVDESSVSGNPTELIDDDLEEEVLSSLALNNVSSQRSYKLAKAFMQRDIATVTTEVGKHVIEQTAKSSRNQVESLVDPESDGSIGDLQGSESAFFERFSEEISSLKSKTTDTNDPDAVVRLTKHSFDDDSEFWVAELAGTDASGKTRERALKALAEELPASNDSS